MTNFNENSKYELSQKSTQLELTPLHADGFSEASETQEWIISMRWQLS